MQYRLLSYFRPVRPSGTASAHRPQPPKPNPMTTTNPNPVPARRKTRTTRLTVDIDPSTFRWLTALAKANEVTPGTLLAQAAFCMADYAGRRPGSWEAGQAGEMLVASGWPKGPFQQDCQLCRGQDHIENNARRLSDGTLAPQAS